MLKNWVLLASVSYGVGFGSTLAISRNLQQSTLAGLTTVPAVAASMILLSHQRKREIDRQIAKLKFNLDELQQQKQLLQDQLQAKEDSSQEIEVKTAEKRYILEKINTELSQIETQRQLSIKAAKESNLALQNIDEYINQRFSTKKEIDVEISDLQSQLYKLQTKATRVEADFRGVEYKIFQAEEQEKRTLISIKESNLALQNIDECISQRFSTKQQLDIEISDLQSQLYKLQTKATHVEIDLRGVEYKISQAGERERQILISIDSLKESIEEKQSLLNSLNLKIISQQEISQQSSQPEEKNQLSNIIDIADQLLDVNTKQFEVVGSDLSTASEEWSIHLINDPYLPILKHIEKHEVVTESEICSILGNARIARQFALKFREYFKYLPFSIKVESSNSGNRYVKEIISIINSQTFHDVSSLNTKEPELDLSATELVTPAYDTCHSCGRSPIPGQESCFDCMVKKLAFTTTKKS